MAEKLHRQYGGLYKITELDDDRIEGDSFFILADQDSPKEHLTILEDLVNGDSSDFTDDKNILEGNYIVTPIVDSIYISEKYLNELDEEIINEELELDAKSREGKEE